MDLGVMGTTPKSADCPHLQPAFPGNCCSCSVWLEGGSGRVLTSCKAFFMSKDFCKPIHFN